MSPSSISRASIKPTASRAEVERLGRRCLTLKADVADPDQMHDVMAKISSTAAFPLPLPAEFAPGPDSPPPRVEPSGYAMTKWMVIYQTRHMAQLLGVRNIRVNAVAPGVTMSPATKAVVPEPIVDVLVGASALRTALEPENHTGLIVVLASDESS